MEKVLEDIYPIMGVEHDAILSRQGDVTLVYEVQPPEIFTLSISDYEAIHQALVKAIKVLPKHSVLHKQDWFIQSKYKGDGEEKQKSFLSRSSDLFFEGRPYLQHTCYIMLTKKPQGRKAVNSMFSSLVQNTIIPEETLSDELFQNFADSAGQFKRILEDSNLMKLRRLRNDELQSQRKKGGLLEKYCSLSQTEEDLFIKDISFDNGIEVGHQHCELYTLADVNDLPSLCGSRI